MIPSHKRHLSKRTTLAETYTVAKSDYCSQDCVDIASGCKSRENTSKKCSKVSYKLTVHSKPSVQIPFIKIYYFMNTISFYT